MTMHELYMKTERELLNENTEITVIKGGKQIRGNWFSNNIIVYWNASIEMVAFHVTKNSAQIILK